MSTAFLSALEAFTNLNKTLLDIPKEQSASESVDFKNIRITTRRSRCGDYVVVAITKGRHRVKRLETHKDKEEAYKAARRIGRQVKSGKYVIDW